MFSFKSPFSSVAALPAFNIRAGINRKYVYWFCLFWLMIGALELGQDYISALLNGNPFRFTESVSYKLFWLLFIPFSGIVVYGLHKIRFFSSGIADVSVSVLLALSISLVHLFIFSLFLYGVSIFIHTDPWSLTFLISEKLSTRLYISLGIYILLAAGYLLIQRNQQNSETEPYDTFKTITVKHGQTSILVDTDDIRWIESDGPYLSIYTPEKKHVVLDSLKHIITRLPGNFRRIHRSTIVNLDKISELKSRLNGDYDVLLEDGRVLRLSRNYAKPLKGSLL